LREWFNQHLEKPKRFRRSRCSRGEDKGVCWFKSSAREHIAKVYEMAYLLEENGFAVRVFRSRRVGYIVCEDEHQIVAEPFSDLRL